MAKSRKRRPKTKAELRDKLAGENRPSRGYIPTERDDLMTRLQRTWKKFRKSKYKIKDDGAE